jgi:hypothetical protein
MADTRNAAGVVALQEAMACARAHMYYAYAKSGWQLL